MFSLMKRIMPQLHSRKDTQVSLAHEKGQKQVQSKPLQSR